MTKKILLLLIFISTIIYAETKPSTDVFEYRLKQLESKYITIEIQNEELIRQKLQLQDSIKTINNKYKNQMKTIKNENQNQVNIYKDIIDSNQSVHSNIMNLILVVVTLFAAFASWFSFSWIGKKVEERIDSKANDKIKKIEETIEKSNNSLKEIYDLKMALNNKTKEYEDILTDYKDELKELKYKSLESFTDEDKRKLDRIAKEINTKKDKTPEDWFFIALEHQENKNFSEAINAYEKTLELKSRDSSVHHNLGLIYGELEEYELAIECYTNSLKYNSRTPSTYTNLFEQALMSNNKINDKILNTYINTYKDKLPDFIQYEMLNIFELIKNGELIEDRFQEWKNKYSTTTLRWDFRELSNWIKKEKNLELKKQLNNAVSFFQNHQVEINSQK